MGIGLFGEVEIEVGWIGGRVEFREGRHKDTDLVLKLVLVCILQVLFLCNVIIIMF